MSESAEEVTIIIKYVEKFYVPLVSIAFVLTRFFLLKGLLPIRSTKSPSP